VSFSHGDGEVRALLGAYRETLLVLKGALEHGDLRAALLGDPLEPLFRRTSDFNTKGVRS
jgi:hypothetical protein